MHREDGRIGGWRVVPALLAAAGIVAVLPVTGAAAVGGGASGKSGALATSHFPFTPANVDPALARRLAATLGLASLRFTPAVRSSRGDRVVTMAVRVDRATAQAITVRRTLADASVGRRADALDSTPLVAPTRYNLGSARGFASFAAATPKALALPSGIRDAALPDIAAFRLDSPKPAKVPRFQPRIAFEDASDAGRTPRTLDGAGERSVDVGGSYRVMKNLNVTAGVRVSQDRNRIAPLTDGVADDQAVYVGTQLRF